MAERLISCDGDYRLPRSTLPHRYDINLKLDPSPDETVYAGRVTILGTAQMLTDTVVLHANNLNVSSIHLFKGGKDIYSTYQMASDDTHFLSVMTSEQLSPGDEFTLEIEYLGHYYNYQNGIFRDSYKDKKEDTKYLLGTQMEATYARSVFPCYDEPDHKAFFFVTITCPSKYHVVSNAPLASTKHMSQEGQRMFSFKASPLMPSYLVAFVVSEFDYVSNSDEDVEQFIFSKEFRCYAQPDEKKSMNFSLDFGQRTLSFLEEYTDVEYAMEKMYNVAVPSFGGAMENWGLVLYGEYALAERRNKDGVIVNAETIAEIMSHEFAHMWFGNEVTPKWWDNTWLSEGFATYFQFYATSQVIPSWNIMDKFVTNSVHGALYYDSFKRSKSMNHPATTPVDIRRKFNFVSYSKAGSVIRMMQHVLGEDTFRQSLRTYLKSIPKGSTVPDILYAAMQSSAENNKEAMLPEGVTAKEVMGSWADQPGYPLINITRSEQDDTFTVYQRRFYRNQETFSDERWWVPLNWVTENNLDFSSTSPQQWMSPMLDQMTLHIENSTPYFILNKQQTGYYRIMYDSDNWEAINKVLHDDPMQIHELNRAQIIDDSMEFSAVGILPYNTSMRLMSYLSSETQYTPWKVAGSAFRRLQHLMRDSTHYNRYEKMIQRLNSKRLKHLGVSNSKKDSHSTRSNRKSALELACAVNSVECTLRDVSQWLAPQNLASYGSVLCATLRKLSPLQESTRWNLLWESFSRSQDLTLRDNILEGLSCSRNGDILKQFLGKALQKDLHTSEVSFLVEHVVTSTPEGPAVVMDFLMQHLPTVKRRLWGNSGMSNILKALGEQITSNNEITKLETLTNKWKENLTPEELDQVELALEEAHHNIQWIKHRRHNLEQWLLNNVDKN